MTQNFMEKTLQQYRERLQKQSLDYQSKEFERRYQIEAERLESNEIPFDSEALQAEIIKAIKEEAEAEINDTIEAERQKLMAAGE